MGDTQGLLCTGLGRMVIDPLPVALMEAHSAARLGPMSGEKIRYDALC